MVSKIIYFLLLVIFTTAGNNLIAQNNEFKKYNYENSFSSSQLAFSFNIPASCKIKAEYDGTGYLLNCIDTLKANNGCMNGIIFKIKYFSKNLDSALLEMKVQNQSSSEKLSVWTTIGKDKKPKIVIPLTKENENYSSVSYSHKDIFPCENGLQRKIKGSKQFIYFSDGKQTICIVSFVNELEEKFQEELKNSFEFNVAKKHK